MSFMPRITAETRAIETLRPLAWRRWPGVIADVWHVRGAAGGGGYYLSPYPRLVVFLEGGAEAMRLRAQADAEWCSGVGAFYVPGGQPLWSDLRHTQDFAHLDLHLEPGPLLHRLCPVASEARTEALHLLPAEAAGYGRVRSMAEIIAQEVDSPQRSDLMLDGLVTAILAEVLGLEAVPVEPMGRGGLSPHMIRRLDQFTRDNLHRRMTVPDLAEVAGLSESWFARAFKQSLNTTPQRWLMQTRIARATELMADPALGLAEIAAATGFADQAHLTRAFGAVHGQTPGVWRRARLGGTRSKPGGLVQATGHILS
ncbi:MAG: transcriptional regulator [Roseovarius sp. BRH_c41]|jgi:AraC family transcriptional regulator|uniref:helix-turn-helix domain-containing protein n=1 Tax=Roseovarius sp. BRH_c41 TaxID=1629709 RepID=UPI0005F270E7|nr:AraC family transcriptional regulator [Roseovarius sp. BRH_c41]KJS43937.1 MAG: transcriptional regulator [Roseovarius sp. BRH_c41]